MVRIAMLLSNAFRPDPRVLKEARTLVGHGHQVLILCWVRENSFPSTEQPLPSLQIRRIQTISSTYGIGIRQILPLLRFWFAALPPLTQFDPEVVHCHDFDTLPVGWLWAKWHHKLLIYDAHEYYAELIKPRLKSVVGSLLECWITNAEQFFARRADALITVDDNLAAIYQRMNARVVVLGHHPPKEMAQVQNPIFTRGEINLIYAGRLSRDRGLLDYVLLLRRLLEMGIPARLTLAGVFTPYQEEQAFTSSARGLEEHITLLGWLPFDRMAQTLRTADVGLALFQPDPRFLNATPVKLYEYMAGGLPVIASNFPAIASVVQAAECGVLVDTPVNLDRIAQVIRSWWHERSIPQRMGENGRQAVLAAYNWEITGANLVNIYNSLLGNTDANSTES